MTPTQRRSTAVFVLAAIIVVVYVLVFGAADMAGVPPTGTGIPPTTTSCTTGRCS